MEPPPAPHAVANTKLLRGSLSAFRVTLGLKAKLTIDKEAGVANQAGQQACAEQAGRAG